MVAQQASAPSADLDTSTSTGGTVDLSNQYETPAPEPHASFSTLKDRIRHHYELCSDYYYSLWYGALCFSLISLLSLPLSPLSRNMVRF